jgi:hypothetical protein
VGGVGQDQVEAVDLDRLLAQSHRNTVGQAARYSRSVPV